QRQADELVRHYRTVLAQPAVESLTYWGLGDAGAWLGAPVGLVRADGTPKTSYHARKALIGQDCWVRDRNLRTDADGRVSVRRGRPRGGPGLVRRLPARPRRRARAVHDPSGRWGSAAVPSSEGSAESTNRSGSTAATGRSEAHSANTSSDAVARSRNSPISTMIPSVSTPRDTRARVDSGLASRVKAVSPKASRVRKLKEETIASTRASTSSAAALTTS